jgi:hypothetical protein
MKNNGIEGAKPAVTLASLPALTVTAKLAHSFSTQLIQSAALFSRLAGKIEKTCAVKPNGEMIVDYKSYVSGAVFAALSFLEATINELFWAVRENNEAVKVLSIEVIEALKSITEENLGRIYILERFQVALALARKQLFDRGKTPYQDVNLLRVLRNALIHYVPEWVGDEPQKLEKILESKFSLSPFHGSASLFFPHRCLSHGCAKWAVESSLKFVNDFCKKVGLTPKYDSSSPSLLTE